jgi:sarcosine oxidase
LTVTGGLSLGAPDGAFVSGAVRSAQTHGLDHEVLQTDALRARFPGILAPDGRVGVWEANAGILQPEHGVAAALDLAARHGAEIHHREPVMAYRAEADGVVVSTPGAQYRAGRLIVAAGPWAAELLADLGLPLAVRRVLYAHFLSTDAERFDRRRFPVCLLDVPEGHYYAVPGGKSESFKFGRHEGGPACTPHTADREVHDEEIEALRSVLARYMPGAAGPLDRAVTCLYTMTPDEHFIVDRVPLHPQIAFACGFSGHGFKFAPVIGESLAELALDGSTKNDIGFLSAGRLRREPTEPERPAK